MLFVTFAVGCYAAYGFGRWWALARQVAPPTDAQSLDASDNPLAAALPLSGQWAFDELEWNIKSELVGTAALDTEFNALLPIGERDFGERQAQGAVGRAGHRAERGR